MAPAAQAEREIQQPAATAAQADEEASADTCQVPSPLSAAALRLHTRWKLTWLQVPSHRIVLRAPTRAPVLGSVS